MNRRLFLKGVLTSGAVVSAVGAGLLSPISVFAGVAEFEKANNAIANTVASASEGNFKFKAPKLAENGAVVPLEVNASKMSGVSRIAIYIKNNPTPLAASFNFSGGATGFVSTRVRMGKSSPVSAIVVANGRTSVITKEVKVTVGGCGG